MKKNGAIYIRVSTDKQEELSPDAQKRLLLEYAASHDILISKDYIFQDNGISGRNVKKRPAFQNMIALAKSKEHPIDCIIVWKYSRFARNQEESILYKSLLRKNNVDVISITENTTGEFGTLIERIIEWMDEYYSIRLSGEVMRGMTENALRGHYQSDAPIGYISMGNGKPPVIDPETKVIPLTIKDMFLSGKNTMQITRYLNNKGYHTKRGNQFDTRGVDYILSNPFYCGKARWNYTEHGRKRKPSEEVIIADGDWEPLWDEATYNEIMKILASRKTIKARNISSCKHWLSGLLICSSCGRTLSYVGSKSGRGFPCWGYGKGYCSKSHFISLEPLEHYVIDGLKQLLISNDFTYTIVREQTEEDHSRLLELKEDLKRLSGKEARAKAAYLDGIDSKVEYRENKEYFTRIRNEIEHEIAELEQGENSDEKSQEIFDAQMISNISDVITLLEDPKIDYVTKGESIRKIVDHITFNRESTTFDFSLRLPI